MRDILAAAGRSGDPQVRGVRVESGRRREPRGAVRSVQRDGGRGVAAARKRRGCREKETKNHGLVLKPCISGKTMGKRENYR